MYVSDWGRKVIMNFEGFSAKPYICPAGVKTQGFGHTAAAGGVVIGKPPVWSRAYAEKVLADDLVRFGNQVQQLITRPIAQHQFDAFVSLAFNIGIGAFGRSTALRRFNSGDERGAAAAILMWNKARVNGKLTTLAGLVRRRKTEMMMFSGFKDLDFDGERDPTDAVYGTLPQGGVKAEEVIAQPTPPDVEPIAPKPQTHASDTVAKFIRVVIVVAIVATAIYFMLPK